MSKATLKCRLCMRTKHLAKIFEIGEDDRLSSKISFCVDVKVTLEDEMPAMICRRCRNKIQTFYNFKQKCLSVDVELRSKAKNFTLETELGVTYNEKQFKNNKLLIPVVNYELPIHFENNFEDVSDFELSDTYFGNDLENFVVNCPKYDSDSIITENDVTVTEEMCINEIKAENNETRSEEIIIASHESQCCPTQCELCGCVFNTKFEFKKHLSSHSEKKLYQCKFCPKRFTRTETNINHMRSHLGLKPFICEICGQSSTKQQDLVRHMKIHSDEKNHACTTCGRRFKRSGDLCSHIRTHTGARPYKCRICEKDYTSHSGLRKHYKTHEIK